MFIAVHSGAGSYSSSMLDSCAALCSKACRSGMDVLKTGGSCLNGAVAAISILEDSPLTNAGVGANLAENGTVELDASIMLSSDGAFGAVAAVPCVRHPCEVAARLLSEGRDRQRAGGLVAPLVLCGNGAMSWARARGLAVEDNSELTTSRSVALHEMYKRQIADETADDGSSVERRLDTVGVVCVDRRSEACAAVSSGGVALKLPGRIGQAGLYGCGCWAESEPMHGKRGRSVAVSTSGTGEHLVQALLARSCVENIFQDSLVNGVQSTMSNGFLRCQRLRSVSQKLGGLLAIDYDSRQPNVVELAWAHTTKNLYVGYMTASDKRARTHLSAQPLESVGVSFTMEAKMIRLDSKGDRQASK